ncbi:MAG: 1-(5-phosphoribosyl)-5-[(5-phosphoribosylamino)methylideneamino]imidazole-4-carboxamide isomerase [Pseudomonadota bacterium]
MLAIPAIDLKEGQCVRLRQGRMDDATVFSDDPVAMAAHWRAEGARRLHIVDLDGAFAGAPRNKALVQEMVVAMGDVPVQVGGGIRSLEIAATYFEVGISAVIVGTKAVEDPAFLAELANAYPGRILFGLDARSGEVATEGWDVGSGRSATDLACAAARLPLAGIVYTDIDRDGMLSGVNVEATWELAQACGLPVVASGGISSIDDIADLKAAFADAPDLLLGAITGRAIYEGTLSLPEAQGLLDG